MHKILFSFIFIFSAVICTAQNFSGQWKGGFVDKSVSPFSWGGDRCDYVLDLDVKGKTVTGYSYTYFTDGGKKYYTICKLKGTADKNRKYVEIRETERTKTNVPQNISNSFQVHKLTWRKNGDNELLEGTWVPAPGQESNNMGFGTTALAKRQLTEISSLAKKINAKKDPASSPEKTAVAFTKPKVPAAPKKNIPEITKTEGGTVTKAIAKTPVKTIPKTPILILKDTAKKITLTPKIPLPEQRFIPADFEKRSNSVLQTVNVDNPSVKIELYDNGEIDGDSISLFYNGRVLLAHRRLTENPITLELPVNNDEENELVMFADNLGTLPPNTALMIVRDGNKRYEVRITSDLKKSGVIRFIHKKTAGESH